MTPTAPTTCTPSTRRTGTRKKHRRSRADIAAAVRRVAAERYEPVAELAPYIPPAGRSPNRLVNWIVQGVGDRAGGRVHLDGFHNPDLGWMTSIPALERLFAACPWLIADPSAPGHFIDGGGI